MLLSDLEGFQKLYNEREGKGVFYSYPIDESVIKTYGITQEELEPFINSFDEVNNRHWSDTVAEILKKREQAKNDKLKSTHIYRLGDGFVDVLLPPKEIVVPPKEITLSLIEVNKSLLSKIKENEQLIEKLTPREFEELVCEILDKNGLSVCLTKQTCDGGKDIIVCENKLIGNFLTYVECKKYRRDRPVSVSIVRELYGTVMADNVTAGLLVTTSYFSEDAEEFTKKVKNRMSLIDYNGLFDVISNTNI